MVLLWGANRWLEHAEQLLDKGTLLICVLICILGGVPHATAFYSRSSQPRFLQQALRSPECSCGGSGWTCRQMCAAPAREPLLHS